MRNDRTEIVFQRPSLTPLEQARAFAVVLPDAANGIETIAGLYARDLYSPHPITTEEASDARSVLVGAATCALAEVVARRK